MARKDELIVGLDIGTNKTCVVVGELTPDSLDIIGVGTAPATGMRKGAIIDIESTVQSIVQAVEQAETMAGCEITNVYAGISGGHIRSINTRGAVAVKDPSQITRQDVVRAIENAKAVALPNERRVLHILPQEFIVDSQDGIKKPEGMNGVRLEAKVHIITALDTSALNIIRCCEKAKLNAVELVFQGLASAQAVLTEDEKRLGAALIDLGGGTSDVLIFFDGAIVHASVVTLGGNLISNDIAMGLRTPFEDAERIKQHFGCAMTSMVGKEETIEVPSVGDRKPRPQPRHVLTEIIEPRVEEIFDYIHEEIQRSGYEDFLSAGAVVTGGATMLDGMSEIAGQRLNMPVRRGSVRGVGGLLDVVRSPLYATGVGLVLWGHQWEERRRGEEEQNGLWTRFRRGMSHAWQALF